MKQRDILFKPFLIPAIEVEAKDVTRRTIEVEGEYDKVRIVNEATIAVYSKKEMEDVEKKLTGTIASFGDDEYYVKCKYDIGQLLYVKESWRYAGGYKGVVENFVYQRDEPWNGPFISPLFMPKAAARIWVKVKDITVERLGAITEAEAIKEGMNDSFLIEDFRKRDELNEKLVKRDPLQNFLYLSPLERFARVWNYINGKDSFEASKQNWVWRIAFEKVR